MRLSKFSDGIEKVEGKSFQKSYIKTTEEFYVDCPYCGNTIDCGDDSTVMKCTSCKKKFYADFDFSKIL